MGETTILSPQIEWNNHKSSLLLPALLDFYFLFCHPKYCGPGSVTPLPNHLFLNYKSKMVGDLKEVGFAYL
jgi:hypothetical protein